jgi:formylglycine-generating enzyme required for sulfatase activity
MIVLRMLALVYLVLLLGCGDPPRATSATPQRWTNSIGLEFALIPAGTFTMGANASGDDGAKSHAVTISKSYFLARKCVTKAMFKRFRAETGVDYPELGLDPGPRDHEWNDAGAYDRPNSYFSMYLWSGDDDSSASAASWTVAEQFCEWLSRKEGMSYRLATEAEWERAKLGGADSWPWFKGMDSHRGNYAMLGSNPEMSPYHFAGNYEVWPMNPYGMFPMSNEWVHDRYGSMSSGAETDPTGPTVLGSPGLSRVFRGSGMMRLPKATDQRIGQIRIVCEVDVHFHAPEPVQHAAPPMRPVRPLPSSTLDLGSGVTMDLLQVPAQTFAMGRPKPAIGWGTKEWPQTVVTLPHSYWLGRYEVTQAQYRALTGKSPSHFPGDDHPVECVGYTDIQGFFVTLNQRERVAGRLPADDEYRLPTEAEWECAYRAGTDTLYPFGDDPLDVPFYEIVDIATGTGPVGSKRSNPWGFFDMGGNVLEMTCQLFDPYPGGKVSDPFENPSAHGIWGMYVGWLAGRGGSWCMGPYASRSTLRRGIHGNSRCHYIGFRVARGQIIKPPMMK